MGQERVPMNYGLDLSNQICALEIGRFEKLCYSTDSPEPDLFSSSSYETLKPPTRDRFETTACLHVVRVLSRPPRTLRR